MRKYSGSSTGLQELAMATLEHIETRGRVGFSLEVLGFEKTQDEGVNVEYFACRLFFVAFDQKVGHPGTYSLHVGELPNFINWLRQIPTQLNGSFETAEPF